jgi:hypothetical protein
MSWRKVAAIYIVLAVLAGAVLVGGPADLPAPDVPNPPSVGPSLLDAEAAAVSAVTFRRGSTVVRAAREDGRWRIVEHTGEPIPSDLIDATIATLTAGQSAERLTDGTERPLSEYGLDTPSATLEIVLPGAPVSGVTVLVGTRNPTRTAVYARRSDQPTVYLVGMNLSYYLDLIFDAAKT